MVAGHMQYGGGGGVEVELLVLFTLFKTDMYRYRNGDRRVIVPKLAVAINEARTPHYVEPAVRVPRAGSTSYYVSFFLHSISGHRREGK
jgi:hypothetical protein